MGVGVLHSTGLVVGRRPRDELARLIDARNRTLRPKQVHLQQGDLERVCRQPTTRDRVGCSVGTRQNTSSARARRSMGIRMTLLTTERLLWHCGAHTAEPKNRPNQADSADSLSPKHCVFGGLHAVGARTESLCFMVVRASTPEMLWKIVRSMSKVVLGVTSTCRHRTPCRAPPSVLSSLFAGCATRVRVLSLTPLPWP